MEVSGQLHALAFLSLSERAWTQFDWKLGGPQSQSGHAGEQKNSQSLTEFPKQEKLGRLGKLRSLVLQFYWFRI